MRDYKADFIAEINKIENEALRDATLAMVPDIPEYFWHIPASSSGKYHPACDLGEGGLVRHSLMVERIALDLVNAEIFVEDTMKNRDCARIAALFHDILKSGPVAEDGTYSEHTEFKHPIYAAKFICEKLEAYVFTKMDIINAIGSHMGKWNTSKYEEGVILPKPISPFEKLIHTADFIASRKYIGGLEEWKE